MFVHAFDTLKIPVHRFRTWDIQTKVIRLSRLQISFEVKTHDLIDYQLTVGSLLPAITFMWSDQQFPGWPQFFQQELFPSVPSLADFNCTITFRSFQWTFHLNFQYANLVTPIISYCLFSNLSCARSVIHPGNCSPGLSALSWVGFNYPIYFQNLLLDLLIVLLHCTLDIN